jgi:hypothetical protein
MRILRDQGIYKFTIDKLKTWGHDVITVFLCCRAQ